MMRVTIADPDQSERAALGRSYRELLACSPQGLLATALVEDALFEERIQPSVGLFAETLWNPHQSDAAILARAMRPYIRGE
jgi:hypothetical protein